jgi:hypothetical protein
MMSEVSFEVHDGGIDPIGPESMAAKLVWHGAPTLAGLKTASLFTLPCAGIKPFFAQLRKLNDALNDKGVFLTVLRLRNERALVYIYRKNRLAQDLARRGVAGYLRAAGYRAGSVAEYLERLQSRLSAYETTGFPHEIGLFLGYPLHDVAGFCAHCGKNYLLCDYWKVYSNAEEARKMFRRYKACEAVYRRRFARGTSLARLVVAL